MRYNFGNCDQQLHKSWIKFCKNLITTCVSYLLGKKYLILLSNVRNKKQKTKIIIYKRLKNISRFIILQGNMQAVDVNTNEIVICLHDANTRFVLPVNDTLHTNSLKLFTDANLRNSVFANTNAKRG